MRGNFKQDVNIAGAAKLTNSTSSLDVRLETSVTEAALLSCFFLVFKVKGRFEYIPAFTGVKAEALCTGLHTYTLVTQVYSSHNVCYFEIRDFYFRMSKLDTKGTTSKFRILLL